MVATNSLEEEIEDLI